MKKALLGTFEAGGLEFVTDALQAAGIECEVQQYRASPNYEDRLPKHDVYVDEERVADARAAVARWEAEAEAAVLREADAPRPTPEELAGDAEWEKAQREAKRAALASGERARRRWPYPVVIAIAATLLAWLAAGR